MIHNPRQAWAVLTLVTALNQPFPGAAQGPLLPPGPPAPSMKTLEQVEPRTPISSLPYAITNSGSYYLTGSLTAGPGVTGVVIRASHVTIDLMGFTLFGAGATVPGINVPTAITNLTIRNGGLTGWRGTNAVNASLVEVGRYENLNLRDNLGYGLRAGRSSIITDCIAESNTWVGIAAAAGSVIQRCTATGNGFPGLGTTDDGIVATGEATIEDCVALRNGGSGILAANAPALIINCVSRGNENFGIEASSGSQVRDCVATENGNSGIGVGSKAVIQGCASHNNTNSGIFAVNGGTIIDCAANENGANGIWVDAGSLVRGNSCADSGQAGILTNSGENRIEQNRLTGNGIGLEVNGTVNLIIGNSARGNGTNYVITANNRVGTIVTPPLSGAISGNGPGAGSGATDPFANFAF